MSSFGFCSKRSISRILLRAYVLACVRLCSLLDLQQLMAFPHLTKVKVQPKQVQVFHSVALLAWPVLSPLLAVVEPPIKLRGLLLGWWLVLCLE